MGSAKPQERSLGSGISLPQWMKGKIDRFDFEQSAFSPPSQDDSFFYIRYPRNQEPAAAEPEGFKNISQVISEKTTAAAGSQVSGVQQPVPDFGGKSREIDFSKHPLPCQPFVPTATNKENGVNQAKIVIAGKKQRSQGTDDGFHSEPALCGKSIVDVAKQMMSGKLSKPFPLEQRQHQRQERKSEDEAPKKGGSKSLPATPLTSPMGSPDSSPKARRRLHSNRYFTGPFIPDREKYQNGWILSSILGQSREMIVPKIEEEDESAALELSPPPKALSRKKSISSQNLTYIGKEDKAEKEKPTVLGNVLQAKPSELREMNFWSPTSM